MKIFKNTYRRHFNSRSIFESICIRLQTWNVAGEIFALLGCYLAYVHGSYRRVGITYRSHPQGSGLLDTWRWDR